MKKTTPEKSIPQTPRKPIPPENLRLIRQEDRKKLRQNLPNPFENLDPAPRGPDGSNSGNYITPKGPNPDYL